MAAPKGNQYAKGCETSGRPEKPIDWEAFEELCNIHCTHDEISSVLRISKAQLYERVVKHYGEVFPTIYKRYSEEGKSSLRRLQFKQAKTNCSMGIWLGKQYLGQRDAEKEEQKMNEESMRTLITLMTQLKAIQAPSERLNIADTSNNTEIKS